MINIIPKIISRISSFFCPKLAKKSSNPYATHLPILIGITKLFKIKRVLELGSGDYSTPVLLNRTWFPDLEHLTSLEDDPKWACKLREQLKPDNRFQLIEVDTSISSVIKNIELREFDMIFVDNSVVEIERANTLLHLSASNLLETIVLIHDYEVMSYQRATDLFANRFSFFAFNPITGLVWNGKFINKYALWMIASALRWYAPLVAPNDVARWNHIFEKMRFLTAPK